MGGARFLTPLVGRIQTMPAFGRHPAAMDIDIDDQGRIVGLF
jgi:formate--tetrahydrofolate ligase